LVNLEVSENLYTITFNKEDISDDFVKRLMMKARIDEILKKSTMTEEAAYDISEEIKMEWWQKNKHWIMDKINQS
jgi:hypothetical protein